MDFGAMTPQKRGFVLGLGAALLTFLVYSSSSTPRPGADGSVPGNGAVFDAAPNGLSGKLWKAIPFRKYSGPVLYGPGAPIVEPRAIPPATGELNCEKWVVMTTIFEPTKIVKQIGEMKSRGWCMVVVGDKKGLATYPSADNVVYLTPDKQEALPYATSQMLYWNHFGRKNIGLLYALHHGAKIIYDTDDDNELITKDYAMDEWLAYLGKQTAIPAPKNPAHIYNPYPLFGSHRSGQEGKPEFMWCRGTPMDFIRDASTMPSEEDATAIDAKSVTVIQSLANHDPDVDGIYRLTKPLPIDFSAKQRIVGLPPGTMTPWNAQAVIFKYEAFWGLLLPVTVQGRVTDIWRSYFTQRIMWDVGQTLTFTNPWVTQFRNAHNFMRDFDAEQDLYMRATDLVRWLIEWRPRAATVPGMVEEMAIAMYEVGVIEMHDVGLYQAFLTDLHAMNYQFPPVNTRRFVAEKPVPVNAFIDGRNVNF